MVDIIVFKLFQSFSSCRCVGIDVVVEHFVSRLGDSGTLRNEVPLDLDWLRQFADHGLQKVLRSTAWN